jgi:hypothetical protein
MRVLALTFVLLSTGCQLYFGTGDDDGLALPDAGRPVADAASGCESTGDGTLSVCGVIVDLETGEAVTAPTSIRFYDAVAYANADDTELQLRSIERGANGTFAAIGIEPTSSGTLAVVVDDRTAATDDYAPTVTVFRAISGQLADVRTAAFRHATDAAWTAAVGLPSGTFISHEAILETFVFAGEPAAGVTVTENGSTTMATYVFGDASTATHAQIAPGAVTGANGAFVIFDDRPVGTVSGTGGTPPGCGWEDAFVRGRYLTMTVTALESWCKI